MPVPHFGWPVVPGLASGPHGELRPTPPAPGLSRSGRCRGNEGPTQSPRLQAPGSQSGHRQRPERKAAGRWAKKARFLDAKVTEPADQSIKKQPADRPRNFAITATGNGRIYAQRRIRRGNPLQTHACSTCNWTAPQTFPPYGSHKKVTPQRAPCCSADPADV